MYTKIYSELMQYTLKLKLKKDLYIIKINNKNYILRIYNEFEHGCSPACEAVLFDCERLDNTEKRIKKNREFYNLMLEHKKKNPYLWKTSKNNQMSIFNIKNYVE